jgi:hypothetical protein
MTAQRLVRFYPRQWRERYGDEFVQVVGEENLTTQQTVDILAGAVDAWISPSVRASVRSSAAGNASGGAAMIQQLKMKCATSTPRYTTKDGLISAGVLIATTIVLLALGIAANRQGYPTLGETLKGVAFPASMMVSMQFWLLKGQPTRVQTFLVMVPLAFLVAISYLATKI